MRPKSGKNGCKLTIARPKSIRSVSSIWIPIGRTVLCPADRLRFVNLAKGLFRNHDKFIVWYSKLLHKLLANVIHWYILYRLVFEYNVCVFELTCRNNGKKCKNFAQCSECITWIRSTKRWMLQLLFASYATHPCMEYILLHQSKCKRNIINCQLKTVSLSYVQRIRINLIEIAQIKHICSWTRRCFWLHRCIFACRRNLLQPWPNLVLLFLLLSNMCISWRQFLCNNECWLTDSCGIYLIPYVCNVILKLYLALLNVHAGNYNFSGFVVYEPINVWYHSQFCRIVWAHHINYKWPRISWTCNLIRDCLWEVASF